jgi:DHA1 family multidrug resistance protein-like MFS transporter
MADHIDVYSETARIMPERESVETAKIVAGRITPNNPSHMLGSNDFDNPMNWPTHRKVYASAVAWAMAFTV